MFYQIEHTVGSTIYFVICILFILVSRIPRTNDGARLWAAAIFFALLARLSLLLHAQQSNLELTLVSYAALIVLEKALLVAGVLQFYGLKPGQVWLWAGTLAAELWLLLVLLTDIPLWAGRASLVIFNLVYLGCFAFVIVKHRQMMPIVFMTAAAVAAALLTLHWLSYPLMYLMPSWQLPGFMIGTGLTLVLYLALLAAILFSLQKRLLDAEEKALELAHHDPLTGLKNKRYLHNIFEKAVLLANRPHQLMAIFYIDLDNFKPINDKAGHGTGDEVLKVVAERLRSSTRSTDICARIGGDEFIIIATQLENHAQVQEVANKLVTQLAEDVVIGNKAYSLGASIGISLYPENGNELKQLIEQADAAMYQIKQAGKRGYKFCDSDPRSH
ncbi:GGDEF domain-containing protein [Shewanella cyperi]|uniref:GGDEF domain-containing protein n=1 Tax=Shewanella cyperi TaxID=2814292 RepID=UPI001A950562|nr:GGDEF domain-containing protein [Shewanella cyperi]QSX40798.1 GGDEF domain-containing protein [Shewanella cyperi]